MPAGDGRAFAPGHRGRQCAAGRLPAEVRALRNGATAERLRSGTRRAEAGLTTCARQRGRRCARPRGRGDGVRLAADRPDRPRGAARRPAGVAAQRGGRGRLSPVNGVRWCFAAAGRGRDRVPADRGVWARSGRGGGWLKKGVDRAPSMYDNINCRNPRAGRALVCRNVRPGPLHRRSHHGRQMPLDSTRRR